MDKKTLVTSRIASNILNIHPNTLRSWDSKGLITSYRSNSTGQRRYDIDNYLKDKNNSYINSKPLNNTPKINICYCRVSSKNQKDDLAHQVDFLKEKFPNHVIITDIASGLNYKRKGLKTILEYAMQKTIGQVVVTYKDRMCRFGFELVEFIIKSAGGEILVLNAVDNTSPQEEMVKDLTSIIHIFSCRLYGLRKYKKTIKKACQEEN